ncbi:tetratricopeptide repeat protein [Puniceicoccaceae bacterium K14]|nr:tetratricopeptide repeat protein [Puniceicoccaceae bacterium K14]
MRIPHSSLQAISLFSIVVAALFLTGCANKEEKIANIERNAENALFDGDIGEAIDLLSKGIKKHKNSASLHRAYGQALADDGKYADAAEALERAITLDPELANLWVNVGEYSELAGNTPKAIEALGQYVLVESGDFLAWKNLATLKADTGDSEGAIEAALTWNNLRPSARPALILGELFQESNNTAQARSWYAQAAAYIDENQAQQGLAQLVQLEADTKQYLQAEARLKEYESRYGALNAPEEIAEAKELIARWREAQAELARAGEELETQRRELEAKRIAMLKQEEDAKRKAEEEEKEAERLAQQQTSDLQIANNDRAPTPLFQENIATETGNSEPTTETQPVAPAPTPVASEADSVETLWDKLGNDPENAAIWHALAAKYSETGEWYDAENCILEAKRREPLSEEISARYLEIISKTQPKQKVLSEALKIRELFPRNEDIALIIARQLRASNAAPRRISRAYNDYLNLATTRSEGYEEATKYITTGN